MESLEKQLKELQEFHDSEESATLEISKISESAVATVLPLVTTPPQQQQSGMPPPPPPPPSKLHHTSYHSLKGCKSRLHLFKSYKSLPAIVYFPQKDESTVLWKQVMLGEFGFQETSNPALATFLISRMLLSSQICADSQVFNHLRGFKTALKNMVIWRNALVYTPASSSSTQSSSSSSSSTSLSSTSSAASTTAKRHCATFITKLDALLRNATATNNTLIHAELVKSTISTKSISGDNLRRMVEAYRKSPVCAMQNDETVRVQVFTNVPTRQYVLTLPVYIASTKPWLVFASISSLSVRTNADAAEISLKDLQFEQSLSFSEMKQLLDGLKIQVAQSIKQLARGGSKLQEQLGTAGRFGYFAIEFLLVRGEDKVLNPLMLRIVDHSTVDLVREVVASQLHALKRTWFVKTGTDTGSNNARMMRPEELQLHLFELCAYEKEVISPGSKATTVLLRLFPFF